MIVTTISTHRRGIALLAISPSTTSGSACCTWFGAVAILPGGIFAMLIRTQLLRPDGAPFHLPAGTKMPSPACGRGAGGEGVQLGGAAEPAVSAVPSTVGL